MADDHFLNLQPGTVVNGRYEIVKCLGAGSMGMVYACRHRELAGHLVAMKVLFTEVARNSVAAARFRNEIVASYGVSHPNVVRAYEYFRDGDLIAFTMEYINGGDLADRINADEPMEYDEIVRMLSQMCGGVQAIHDAGIIHRDLKPENVLLTSTGDIKITDFGIAKTGTGPKLTEHGGVVGTIDYVSAEYLEHGQVDARSDLYSLGIIAYEMITGEPPFKGKSVIETMTMRLKSDPTPPDQVRPDCPHELSMIVMRAMQRDPEHRYQSASEISRDLDAFKAGRELPSQSDEPRPASVRRESAPVEDSARQQRQQGPLAVRGRVLGEEKKSKRGKLTPNFAGDIEPLEPVLKRGAADPLMREDINAPRIAVSHGHLSAERIKRLSHEMSSDDTIWKNILLGAIVLVIGFGAGLFVLRTVLSDGGGDSPLGINEELVPPR